MICPPPASASKALSACQPSLSKTSVGRFATAFMKASRRRLAGAGSILSIALAVTLLSASGVAAQAQTLLPGWYQQSPAASPGARFTGAIAYDAAHNQVVLFGGEGTANSTWLWNGANWSQASPTTSPAGRNDLAMVYDATHGQVVMFGGLDPTTGNRLGDTWLWDGTNWTQPNLSNSPSPRDGSYMVYDSLHGQVVLFGGTNGSDLGDTWLWNGTTWTQASPTVSPSPRSGHMMAYDSAHSQVVLFSGESNGQYVGDTWTWDGANWTSQSPPNSPPGRESAGMAYNAALGETILFGGAIGQGGNINLNDTWAWNGLNWTEQGLLGSGPSARALPSGLTYDSALGQIILFSGNGTADTWEFGIPGNFGQVNVCPSGQTTPSPCSSSVSFIYSVSSATFGTPQVVTQGTPGFDFSLATGNTCVGFVGQTTCTVTATFTPLAPGLRIGAVQLMDTQGNVLTSTPISGNGQAPAIAFDPGTQTTVGTGLSMPQGVALDAAGNVFISNNGSNQVFKVTPDGTQSVVSATGLAHPFGVAVDGAGNVIIADPNNGRVVKVTPAGVQTNVGSVTIPYGVAADGAGNIYIVDSEIDSVVKVTPAGVQTTLPFTGLVNPYYVAVDASGNVYVNDATNIGVYKLTPGGVQTTVPATGLVCPYGVAVDAGGDVFIADPCAGQVVEVPPSGVQSTTATGLVSPISLAVDGTGNIFTGNEAVTGTVYKIARSQAPTINFDTTYVGNISDDSPKSVTVQNIGNQTLSHSAPGLIVAGAPFAQTFGSTQLADCTSSFSLAPGGECDLSIRFRPTAQGSYGSVSVFTDNALNGNSVQQLIYSNGSGLNNTQSLSVSGAGTGNGSITSNPTGITCSETAGASSGTCSASFVGGQTVLLQEVPSAGSTFAGWGGACANYAQNQTCQVTLNASSTAIATFTAAPLSFPLTVSPIGSGSGTVYDTTQQIGCVETSGSSTGSCVGTFTNGAVATLTATATGSSTFLGWGGACATAGTGPTCSVTITQAANATASFVNNSFGNINVCPVGQSTPAPCSATIPLTYNLATTTTIGAVRVVTQGANGLDFTLGSNNTCVGTILAGNACTVNATFTPLAPGLRMGAVEFYDSAANLIASTPISGVGQAPLIAYSPSTQTVVGSGLNGPFDVAVDAAGNLFVTNSSNGQVLKGSQNGVLTAVGTVSGQPAGIGVDGAGNVYVAGQVGSTLVKVPPGCTSVACETYISSGSGLQYFGVAVDGAGDLFASTIISAPGSIAEVVEFPAGCTTAACSIVIWTPPAGTTSSQPEGIAVDSAGNLYIADGALVQVLKVPVGCASISCQIQIGQGQWSSPTGVAVDAAGNVYVSDVNHQSVTEIPVGCAVTACQLTPFSGASTLGLAVDALGNLFVSEIGTNQVVKVSRSQPPSLAFATTNAGSTSTDSPQPVVIHNIGNQPVTGSISLNLGSSFSRTAAQNCLAGISLAPGALCTESFSFTPQSATYFAGSASLFDNNFNLAGASQIINLSGNGATNGVAGTVAVPNLVGQVQTAATTPLTAVGLTMGTVSSTTSDTFPTGTVINQNPAAGTQVNAGSAVNLLVSSGVSLPPSTNPLNFENNYFLTGDYVTAGVTLHGMGHGGFATGTITVPSYASDPTRGVPDGADIIDAFLYWQTVENTATPSSMIATFNGYSVTGQQIGVDVPNYVDGTLTGTLRSYRAAVNVYLPAAASGTRFATGNYSVTLPDGGGAALPLTEGASLVFVYRVLSPNFPLKSVIIYDGSAAPLTGATQVVQGFYDAVGGANGTGKSTNIFTLNGNWNSASANVALGSSNQYSATLNAPGAYAAVILSTPVNNSDNDGILDAWKAGPGAGDFHAGQPGYYDVKTQNWVGLPGAKHGQKDLFVQLDYMCGAVLASGACDTTKENLFPSPDSSGNDPLAMVQQAFANSGVQLHLTIGNAVAEDTCTDGSQLCQFPGQSGVIGWKNSLEFSKLWPRNFVACITGGDCTTRFPYGQKDSYHYVLMGHSLAIPAWNSRYGTLTSIVVSNGVTTIGTADRGAGNINSCPSRITLGGILGNPTLNGVYNTASCSDTKTITVLTPGVPNWSYPNNTLAEPVIGLTSGTISSISGYSDLGGSDSAVTLGLWLTAPNQDMSKKANVVAGTLFHEIGHTLGLGHGGLYYDTPGSYVPTFDANCKPNYQSVMNYLFQLDLLGPNQALAFSNQTLQTVNENTSSSITQLTDASNNAATFPTSAWYVPYTSGSSASPATRHCDGTPLIGDSAYRVDSSVAPITPAWANGQDLSFIGVLQPAERGFNDLTNMDLRQVGATGGEFASLANVLNFGASSAPLNIAAGGTVTLGSGGNVALGSGGVVTLGSGGNVTLGSSGSIALNAGGTVTLGSGGTVGVSSGGTVTPGAGGLVTLGSGGNVSLSSGGVITMGSGGLITLGSGGLVTLGSGGVITLGSGGTIIDVPTSGGSYTVPAGGVIALGSGGVVTLGSGGLVTLGSGGVIALGSGGVVTLGSGGLVTLGSGGVVTLGSGGLVTLGSGGNVTLGSGGVITLGSGGVVTLGSGGLVALGSGGVVTLGSGGNLTASAGGNVTLGAGGQASIGAGGTVTLGSGGVVTLGSGGLVTLGSGGVITLGSGGVITLGSGGLITLGSGGTQTLSAGQTFTFPAGGGTVTLGSGGVVTLGSGGVVTLGSGGVVTLGSGGLVTLGSGGVVTLGSGGTIIEGIGSTIGLGSVSNITPASGGPLAANELNYETANSVVRPPSLPTETSVSSGVRINWKAPAFGVVQTYTIYRSSNGATPIVIGSVSGVNGNPPATEFTDTNPDTTSTTVVYTVTTTLVADPGGSQRQSPASAPAVLKNDQSIVLGPLPSSVTINNPPTITATAMAGGVPNGLQVNFTATGSCSIGSQSIVSNVSSATMTLTGLGNCTVTASQPGATSFNAANAVSGTFLVLPQGSGTQSQTINFPSLPNVQYGNTFSLSASSSAGQAVTFIASGPCSTNGTLSGVGTCKITASAAATTTYSAASLTQSFTIIPAVLSVKATIFSNAYGQAIPTLTYAYSGFVNGESTAVISGAPALSTTATTTSAPGVYPITVSTGSLASSNYSFLYVNGTLTVQTASQTPLILTTSSPLTNNLSETLGVTGGSTNGTISYAVSGPCSVSGAQLTANSGTGSCQVTATMAGNTNYKAVSSTPANIVMLALASQSITFSINPPASAVTNSSFTVAASATSGLAVTYTSAGACTNTGAMYKIVGAGTCSVIVNQAGNTNYSAAAQVTKTTNSTLGTPMVSFTGAPASAVYNSSFNVVATSNASTTPVITSSGACSNVGTAVTMISGTGTCSLTATWAADSSYSGTTANQATKATLATQSITFTTNPPTSAAYNSSFTVAANSTSGNPVIFTSAGACSNSGGIYKMTGGTGSCSVIANAAADANYAAAPAVTKSVAATQATPTVTFTGAPMSAVYLSKFTVASTTNGITAALITTAGACSNSGNIITITSGTGTCSLTATWAAGGNYLGTAATQSSAATPAAQTITFTNNPPASAAYASTFKVAATGGASANPVTFNSAGACTNSGATYTMTNSAGICSVIANQAGNANYAAATPVTKIVTATGPLVTVTPSSVDFGTVYFGSISTKTIVVKNAGTSPLTVKDPILSIVKGGDSKQFIALNLCLLPLPAGRSCTITIAFVAGPYYIPQTATLQVISNSPGSPLPVPLTANVINPQVSANVSGLNFGTIKHGTSSTMNVTLSNPGTTPLALTSLGVTGLGATSFSQTNNCGSSVAAGGRCTISVKFVPAATGKFSANLTAVDNAQSGSGTQSIPLSGAVN